VDSTDWPQILALYSVLKGMSDNPMVALNHAVATAMVRGPQAGLVLLSRGADAYRSCAHLSLKGSQLQYQGRHERQRRLES
jgi:predicted RNA polymerase sigma factor